MSDAKHASSSTESSSSRERTPSPDALKPFVEPELRCETDLIGGTAERDFFGTSTAS